MYLIAEFNPNMGINDCAKLVQGNIDNAENAMKFCKIYIQEYLDKHPIPEYFTDEFTDKDNIGYDMVVEDNSITIYAFKNDKKVEVISYYILDYDIIKQVIKIRCHK